MTTMTAAITQQPDQHRADNRQAAIVTTMATVTVIIAA
jgi:hypothetical protein